MQIINSRTILEERAVQAEIKIAYEGFARSVPRRPATSAFHWRSPPHRCSEACDFFSYRDVIICKEHANFHYCTQNTCDRLIRTSERLVCPLSGFTYDLDLELNPFADYHGNEDHRAGGGGGGGDGQADVDDEENNAPDDYDVETDDRVAHQEKKQKVDDKAAPAVAKERIDLGMRVEMLQEQEEQEEAETTRFRANEKEEQLDWQAITQEQFVPETDLAEEKEEDEQQLRQKRMDLENSNERLAVFESMLMNMFVKFHVTHRNLFRTIALNAERLWKLVQSTDTIAHKKHRYQVEYHLLVVVHNMCHGYNCMQLNVVPFNEWIKAHIPQVRHLKRFCIAKSEIKVKNWTQAGKTFKLCIAELASKERRQHDKQPQLGLSWQS